MGDAGRPASRAGTEAELGSAQATVVSIASLAPLPLNHGYSVPIAGIWLQRSLLNSVSGISNSFETPKRPFDLS